MFITRKKLEQMLAEEREKTYEKQAMQNRHEHMERDLYERIGRVEETLHRRIDNLEKKVLPKEEKAKKCVCCTPVRPY